MDIKALWQKLTSDGVLSEKDLSELEEAGMKREEALERARNEELTYRISGNKAAEEGVGDMVHISAKFGGKKVTAEVPLNAEGRIDPSTEEGQAALKAAGFASAGVVGNKFVGITPDGKFEVLRDYTELAQDLADENEKIQQARDFLAREGIASSMADAMIGSLGAATIIANPAAVLALLKAGAVVAAASTPVLVASCGDDELGKKTEENPFNIVQTNTQVAVLHLEYGPLVDAIKEFKEFYAQQSNAQNATLQAILSAVSALQFKFNQKCEEDTEFRNKLIDMLNQINQSIVKLPDELKPYLTEIINGIHANGDNLEEIIELLKTLNDKADDINKNVKAGTARVLAMMSKLGFCMVGGMNAILQAIIKNGAKLDRIEARLANIEGMINDLNALIKKYGDKGEELGNAILEAISNIDLDVDLSGVEELLKKLVNGQITIGDKIDNLTENVKQFGIKIINKIPNTNDKDYTDKLNTIISLLSNIKPSTDVDLTKIEAALDKVVTGVNNNTELLKKITQQNDIVIEILKNFKAEVGDKMKGIDKWLELIYKKIPAGGQGGCNVDFDALMKKLDEILKAIKDHDVVVTVEGGKCCCTCDGKEVHEGVLGNLDGILG